MREFFIPDDELRGEAMQTPDAGFPLCGGGTEVDPSRWRRDRKRGESSRRSASWKRTEVFAAARRGKRTQGAKEWGKGQRKRSTGEEFPARREGKEGGEKRRRRQEEGTGGSERLGHGF